MAPGRTLSALLVFAIIACPALCSAEASCTSCLDACGEATSQSESHHPERDCGEHPCFCHEMQSADQAATRAASASATITQLAALDCAAVAFDARPGIAGLSAISNALGGTEPLTFIDLPLLI